MRKHFDATICETKITAKKKPPIGGFSSSTQFLTSIGWIAGSAWLVVAHVQLDRLAFPHQ